MGSAKTISKRSQSETGAHVLLSMSRYSVTPLQRGCSQRSPMRSAAQTQEPSPPAPMMQTPPASHSCEVSLQAPSRTLVVVVDVVDVDVVVVDVVKLVVVVLEDAVVLLFVLPLVVDGFSVAVAGCDAVAVVEELEETDSPSVAVDVVGTGVVNTVELVEEASEELMPGPVVAVASVDVAADEEKSESSVAAVELCAVEDVVEEEDDDDDAPVPVDDVEELVGRDDEEKLSPSVLDGSSFVAVVVLVDEKPREEVASVETSEAAVVDCEDEEEELRDRETGRLLVALAPVGTPPVNEMAEDVEEDDEL